MSDVIIEADRFKDVIVIGGGPCALAVCARLCEKCPGSIFTEDEHQRYHWLKQRGHKVNLVNRNVSSHNKFKPNKHKYLQPNFTPDDILVLDETSDKFLGQWDNQFEACKIPYLRSPMFFHVDPANVDGLVSFAHMTKREKELKEIENVVGREYSKHQLKRQMKKKNKKSVPAPSNIAGTKSHDVSGLVDINMRDWKDYYRPSTPIFRDHCQSIVDRYGLHDVVEKEKVLDIKYTLVTIMGTNQSGKGFVITTNKGIYGCKICVLASGHKGKANYPIKPFDDLVKLERSCHTSHIFQHQVTFPPPNLKSNTSGSLCVIGGGLTSAQLVDTAINLGIKEVYLLLRGPIKIKHFDFHLDWVTKYKNLKKSAFYMRDSDEERLEMIYDAREGGSINPEYYKKLLKHEKSGKLRILKHTVVEAAEWDEEDSKWNLELTNNLKLNPNYIVFATGNQADIKSLPFLQSMVTEHDIETVQGLPCLTDNLEWDKDIPLFVTGKNASLKMGPSSANLDGARLGAERIGWFVQDRKLQGHYDWDQELSFSAEQASELKVDEESSSSFSTQLRLASGQLNRYNLLAVYE